MAKGEARLGGTSAARRAGPLAAAGLAAHGAGALVTVALARLLDARGYGAYQQLVACFLVLSMPGSAVLVAVVRRVTGRADGEAWAAAARRACVLAALVMGGLAVASRGWLAGVLSLPDAGGLAEVLSAGGAWLVLSVDRGLLQSRHDYAGLAVNVAVEAGVRTVVTLAAVAAGAGVAGAGAALLVSVVAADAHARRRLARGVGEPSLAGAPYERGGLGVDAVAALGALGLLALLQNLDVILVGRQSPGDAGPYGAVSVASKAVVFGAVVLTGYLMPEAAAGARRGVRAAAQLRAAAGFVLVPAVGLLAVAVVAPGPALRLVFGGELDGASGAFAALVVAMSALAVTVLCTHYLLATGRRGVVGVLAAATVVAAALLAAADGRPVDTARAQLAVHVVLAAVVGAMAWRPARVRGAA